MRLVSTLQFTIFTLIVPPLHAAPLHAAPLPNAARFGQAVAKHTKGYAACVLLEDLSSGTIRAFGDATCEERSAPCSTFKLPHAMIALELGVLRDERQVLRWDGTRQRFRTWERDHDLQSAMTHSVLWTFQRLAPRIGRARMQRLLARLSYGNQRIGPSLTRFWIDGTLSISPREQLALLRGLYRGTLGFSARTMLIGKRLLEQTDPLPGFGGKTGSCSGKERVGWFIGHRRQGARDVVSVMRLSGPGAWGPLARDKTKAILRDLGLL